MGVHIGSTKFNNEFRTSQNLDFLLSCIGEKIEVTTEFYYEDIVFATEDVTIILDPPAALVGTLTDRDELVYCSDAAAFNNYNVGDTFVFSFSPGTPRVITEKINGGLIRVGGASFTGTLAINDYIANVTPFNGVKWAYNILQGAPSYNSLVDGELQQLKLATADATNVAPQAMYFNGILSYQIGNATVQGVSFTNGRQTFKLIHTTYVTPFFLSSQWAALVAGIPPASYSGGNCPNYVYKIELLRALSNPTSIQALSVNKPANVGWFGETFNGGPTNYSIDSFTIQKQSDSSFITKLIFDEVLDIKIKVKNTVNSPFSNGNTKYCINFCYLPENETMYQNNGRTLPQNFVFDRKFATLGGVLANGDNFGTGYQVIKDVQAFIISASEIQINATIDIGATAKSIMTEGDFSRYMIWVTTENHALSDTLSDKVPLLVQVDEFQRTTITSDLIDAEVFFIQHPFEDTSDNIEDDVEVFPVDDVAARVNFNIDLAAYPTDGIKLKRIKPKILLRKAGFPDVILDELSIDVSTYPFIGLAQNIAFTSDRIFKIPSGEVRKVITIARDFAKDLVNGKTNWYINWPFMIRWEYYIQLLGITPPIPTDLVDVSEPFNGLNHFWHAIKTYSGWDMHFEIDFSFEQNGDNAVQSFTRNIVSYDFEGGPEYDGNSIKFYDNDTNVELVSAGIKKIQGWKDTRIEATFVKISGSNPLLADVDIVLWMEPYEAGGIGVARRISSKYAIDAQSWFKSIDASNKTVVTNPVAGTYVGKALIDSSKIPSAAKFRFFARLYDKTPPPCVNGIKIGIRSDFTSYGGAQHVDLRLVFTGNITIYWGDGTSQVAATGVVYTKQYLIDAETELIICGDVGNINEFNLVDVEKNIVTSIDATTLGSSLASILAFTCDQMCFLESIKIPELGVIRRFVLLGSLLDTSYLETLDLRRLTTCDLFFHVQGFLVLSEIKFNSSVSITPSEGFWVVGTNLNQVFNLGTNIIPPIGGSGLNEIWVQNLASAPINFISFTEPVLSTMINKIYTNRLVFDNSGNKRARFDINMPAPSGTYQAPPGYIQADGVTVGNDGSPASAKEQIYVLVNQNIDNTTTKKYNWTFYYN